MRGSKNVTWVYNAKLKDGVILHKGFGDKSLEEQYITLKKKKKTLSLWHFRIFKCHVHKLHPTPHSIVSFKSTQLS